MEDSGDRDLGLEGLGDLSDLVSADPSALGLADRLVMDLDLSAMAFLWDWQAD